MVIEMNNKFKSIFASDEFREEFFVAEVQARLANILEERGISRAELARKLGVSRARVTQIFSDDATNLTLRLLARSFFALDEEPIIITKREYELLRQTSMALEADDKVGKCESTKDILTSSLIAGLLRASDTNDHDNERASRRPDNTRQWVEGSNVVPIRRVANG